MSTELNTHGIYVTLGASNHCNHDREVDDFYATDPRAMELLLELEEFSPSEHIVDICEKGLNNDNEDSQES